MGDQDYCEPDMQVYEETEVKFPFLKRNPDTKDLTPIYIDPKKVFIRKKRKDITFAIDLVENGRLHAF